MIIIIKFIHYLNLQGSYEKWKSWLFRKFAVWQQVVYEF